MAVTNLMKLQTTVSPIGAPQWRLIFSPVERMAALRHKSVAASAIYQEAGGVSESHRFAALGIKICPKIDLKIYPKVSDSQKISVSEKRNKQFVNLVAHLNKR